MTQLLVIRGKFPDSSKVMDIRLNNGIVTSIRKAGTGKVDIGGNEYIIAPTLCDIQVNGAFGIDLQSHDLTVDHIYKLNKALTLQGVTHWIPTLITDSIEAMEHRCRILAEALTDPFLAKHIPGIHLEGPHISPQDGPRGAHPPAHVIPPSISAFNRLYQAANKKITYITLAPELPGATALIRAATRRGTLVALGHHDANIHHIENAVRAGARLCTHLGNGMTPQIHRHQNILWPQLADDRLYASFIADLEHIPPPALHVFTRAKGIQRSIITSDSVFLSGMKAGRYQMFGADVEMKRSGRVCLAGTELLAGSSLMLLQGVWNIYQHTDHTLMQAFEAASILPRSLFNIPAASWPPKKGEKADFMLCKVIPKNKKNRALCVQALVHENQIQLLDT